MPSFFPIGIWASLHQTTFALWKTDILTILSEVETVGIYSVLKALKDKSRILLHISKITARLHVDKINTKRICTVLMVCCSFFFWQNFLLLPFPLQAGIMHVSTASLLSAVTLPWLPSYWKPCKKSQLEWNHPGPSFWRNVFLTSFFRPHTLIFFFFTNDLSPSMMLRRTVSNSEITVLVHFSGFLII